MIRTPPPPKIYDLWCGIEIKRGFTRNWRSIHWWVGKKEFDTRGEARKYCEEMDERSKKQGISIG